MTSDELRTHFNEKFGLKGPWPSTYEVDAHTYAHACQEAFDLALPLDITNERQLMTLEIFVGGIRGLKFKGVELILKKE